MSKKTFTSIDSVGSRRQGDGASSPEWYAVTLRCPAGVKRVLSALSLLARRPGTGVEDAKAPGLVEDGRGGWRGQALMPGYVFVKMTDSPATRALLREVMPDYARVGVGGAVEPLTPEDAARWGLEGGRDPFLPGDEVRIAAGALSGFSGRVKSVDAPAGRMTVTVNLFGLPTDAEIGTDSAVKAA